MAAMEFNLPRSGIHTVHSANEKFRARDDGKGQVRLGRNADLESFASFKGLLVDCTRLQRIWESAKRDYITKNYAGLFADGRKNKSPQPRT